MGNLNCMECKPCDKCIECIALEKCNECIGFTKAYLVKAIVQFNEFCNSIFEDENEIKVTDEILTIKEKINKFKFNYLKLNLELDEELKKLLKESVINRAFELNTNNAFEREDVQKENKDIIIKIKKQLTKYKSSMENYLMKRAIFLKKVGYLARFSHEVAIYMFQNLLILFKEASKIQSKEKETIRLNFSSWIKELFNEDCFQNISKNKSINSQITEEIENEINSDNEIEFLKNLFPDIIKLYFHCFLADIRVNIIYAMEDEKFDPESMIDILLTGLEDDKNILFTFLPGLYCNGQYFENSYIYVTTYPISNPDKFPFKRPIFKTIESDITFDLENPNPNLTLEDRLKNELPTEYVLDPAINFEEPNNYYFYLKEPNQQI